jgi:hypothetical protein
MSHSDQNQEAIISVVAGTVVMERVLTLQIVKILVMNAVME